MSLNSRLRKKCRFSGGIKLTVEGENMDVVLNSRMVVTVKIRRHKRSRYDDDDDDDDDDLQVLHYPPSVYNLFTTNLTVIFLNVCLMFIYTS